VLRATVAIADADGDWRSEITRRAESAREVLRRHPWAIGLLESRKTPGPKTLRHHDATIGPRTHDRRIVMRMPRVQVYLPDDLYRQLKARALPASELLQTAVRAELERQRALEAADQYVKELVSEVGEPTPEEAARADVIVRKIRDRNVTRAG
jgi:post-segregation antitoxin (ccd killing protein)